ncbi:MAG TPA: DUF99 family protein [Candidatus Limnocylindrales bacterium]|nr:DUF99 family protein [Candidatus Limnocylindrales bacterium]
MKRHAPHLLAIDDGPFVKGTSATTPIVAVMTQGAGAVEAVAMTSFAIDGENVSEFLVEWISGLRMIGSVQALVFGGITIAGLAVLDPRQISERLDKPVLIVNRKPPGDEVLVGALAAAGLHDRIALLEKCPRSFDSGHNVHVACAGIGAVEASALVAAGQLRSHLPEALRVAHLIARAVVMGESRGRA